MSKVEVDAIEPQSGTTLTVGGAGDSVNVVPGAIKDASGNIIISKSGTTVTLGASGDTVSVASGAEFVGGGISWQSTIVTGTTLSAVAGNGYWIDTTSNACTVTLPATAAVGDRLIFTDYARSFATNNLTLSQNGLNFQGNSSVPVKYTTNGQSIDIVYSGSTKGWIPNSDDDSAFKVGADLDFLVLAGGGCGGFAEYHGAGGGAGGLRSSFVTTGGGASAEQTLSVTKGEAITVTVGAGAAATTGQDQVQNNGSDSSITATGLNVTSLGGGASGAYRESQRQPGDTGTVAPSGGCGGGGTGNGLQLTGGAGTSGQGFAGGDGSSSAPNYGAGGGGGTGAAGGNGSSSAGGAGGNGTSNSITGSAVTYGGGGGGSTYNGGTPGSGGSGGGGAGSTGNGTAGTANLGGGGGGSERSGSQGSAGGSGIVILRTPTADYTGTVTGSPTVTTSGSDTIIKFTGSGSYTP